MNDSGYRLNRGRANAQQQGRKQDRSAARFIGVLIRQPEVDGTIKNVPTYLGGMCRVTNRLNASLVVQDWPFGDDPRGILDKRNQPPAMREGTLSGLAMSGDWPAEVVNALKQQYQLVLYPHMTPGAEVDVVGLDNVSVMIQLIQRLKALGHTRIGFVGRCGTLAWASERFAGYVSALDRVGLAYHPDWVVSMERMPLLYEGHDAAWRQCVEQVQAIRQQQGVYAWVCSSEWPAYQIYRGMLDRGYRVPRDLSITGFDDTEAVTLGCPPVTTVRIPREMMGKAIFQRLIYRINNPRSPVRQSLFNGEVIDHGSIGPPPDNSHASSHSQPVQKIRQPVAVD